MTNRILNKVIKFCLLNNKLTEHNVNVSFVYKFYFSALTVETSEPLETSEISLNIIIQTFDKGLVWAPC